MYKWRLTDDIRDPHILVSTPPTSEGLLRGDDEVFGKLIVDWTEHDGLNIGPGTL